MWQVKQSNNRSSQLKDRLMKPQGLSKPPLSHNKDQKASLCSRIFLALCPCFSGKSSNNFHEQNSTYQIEQTKSDLHGNSTHSGQTLPDIKKQSNIFNESFQEKSEIQIKREMLKSLNEFYNKFQGEQQVSKSTVQFWHRYQIENCKQNQIFVLGNTQKMLSKIFSVKVEPSAESKQRANKSKIYQKSNNSYSRTNLDKFWHKRYYLFQKFDEGISINEQSWPKIIPQAVSQYLASKIKCQTVLNGFAGVGGDALKLSCTCKRVIAADENETNLKSIYLNLKICGADNVEIRQQSLQSPISIEPDIILISNYCKIQQCLTKTSLSLSQMNPPFKKVLNKAINLCKNIVIVLPANIDVNQLASAFAEELMNSNISTEVCSLKIQKVFYMSKLKYLLVYFGNNVNKSITINDELNFIYKMLQDESKKPFTHKKFVRKLRGILGMVRLLNLIQQSKNSKKGKTCLQKLISLVEQNQIMSAEQIQKAFLQQQKTQKKQPLEEQDYADNEQQVQIQRTLSEFESTQQPIRTSQEHAGVQMYNESISPFKSMAMQRQSFSPRSIKYSQGPSEHLKSKKNKSPPSSLNQQENQHKYSDVVEFCQINLK